MNSRISKGFISLQILIYRGVDIPIIDSEYNIIKEDLEVYFKFARIKNIDENKVWDTMKGPKYKITAENYIFNKTTV